MEPKTVVILGMFRSGTSMTAGILNLLGVDFGDNLLPESRANPLGYFEDMGFMDLNRAMIKAAGGTLHNPPPREPILAQEEAFLQAIYNQVKPPKAAIWGLKDPAASLTIELYAKHLVNPYIIVCRREARPVAESWGKTVEVSLSEGIKLWKVFNQRIDQFLTQYPDIAVLEVRYEALIKHPEKWIDALIDFLGLHVTKQQRKEAVRYVLPKREILKLRAKSLLKSGWEHPGEVPAYVIKRVRHAMRRMFFEKK